MLHSELLFVESVPRQVQASIILGEPLVRRDSHDKLRKKNPREGKYHEDYSLISAAFSSPSCAAFLAAAAAAGDVVVGGMRPLCGALVGMTMSEGGRSKVRPLHGGWRG